MIHDDYGHAPGRGMLKVTGILMVFFGIITLALALMANWAVNEVLTGNWLSMLIGTGLMLWMVLPGAVELITGIVGIVNADHPHRSTLCLVLGGILLMTTLFSVLANGFSWMSLFGFLLPLFYFIGAMRNRQYAVEHDVGRYEPADHANY